MVWLALFSLLIWVPVVYLIFESMPVERAVVVSFMFAWLFLPPVVIPLPGVPDWSKMSATTFGISLIGWIKSPQKFTSLKFSWYDLPILIYCTTPMFASVTNQQGVYDGASAFLEESFRWGFPYLIGRAFLGSARGIQMLCLGLAVSGMVYAPFCLFEIRMSPILKQLVYGLGGTGVGDFGLRYGGYRPAVFLSSGLELGWWMCCASLASLILWQGGVVKTIRGYPIAVLSTGLIIVSIACKSTGALVQSVVGLAIFSVARFTKLLIPVWALMAIPVLYCVCRPLGWWDGSTALSIASSLFGPERTQSLQFRFEQEELLMRAALQRPFFGWSRAVGFNVDGSGKVIVIDGLWIIVFGSSGAFALAALNALHLIPTFLFIRRFRPQDWFTPNVAPALTFAIILPLYMIDNLSNAMVNPVFAVCMGAMIGFLSQPQGFGLEQARGHERHASDRTDRKHPRRPSVRLDSRWHDQTAEAAEANAQAAAEDGATAEAWELFSDAIASRQAAVDQDRSTTRLDRLARSRVLFARFLTHNNYPEFAIAERTQALQIWRSLSEQDDQTSQISKSYAANANDLAWLMIADPRASSERVEQAVLLGEEAVQIVPDQASFWNTLGISYYRRHDYYKAIHALSRSVSLAHDGGGAFDFYYLALANHALGYRVPAQDWLNRADSWTNMHPELFELLGSLLTEVGQTFGRSKQRSSV